MKQTNKETEDDSYLAIDDLIRNEHTCVVWSHKIHACQADIYTACAHVLRISNIAFSGVISVLLTSSFFTPEDQSSLAIRIISAIASLIVAISSSIINAYSFDELAVSHMNCANKLWLVIRRLERLITEVQNETREAIDVCREYDEIIGRLNEIYSEAPKTSKSAYKIARKKLDVNKDFTNSDRDNDRFLPPSLRRK